jgi:hypothetical protein
MAWRAVTDKQWAYILTRECSALKNKDEEKSPSLSARPSPVICQNSFTFGLNNLEN